MSNNIRIGSNVNIASNVSILPNVYIGDNVVIGSGSIIQYGAFIEKDCVIGSNSRVGTNVVLRRETIIGDRSTFGSLSASEGKNWIGNDVLIESQCHITTGLIVEDCVFIAPFFIGANDPDMLHRRRNVKPFIPQAPYIKFGARIAINVTVNPGLIIGREAVIGSGSVVTRNIDDYAIAFGSPARVKGTIKEEQLLSSDRFLEFQNRVKENPPVAIIQRMLENY